MPVTVPLLIVAVAVAPVPPPPTITTFAAPDVEYPLPAAVTWIDEIFPSTFAEGATASAPAPPKLTVGKLVYPLPTLLRQRLVSPEPVCRVPPLSVILAACATPGAAPRFKSLVTRRVPLVSVVPPV